MSYADLSHFALPHMLVVGTALLTLTIGLTKRNAGAWLTVFACVGLAGAIFSFRWLPPRAPFGEGMLIVSPLTSLFQIICLILAFFAVLISASNRPQKNYAEYLAMILFSTVGLMLLVGSEELLMIFIGLELTGLSLYVLAAFNKDDSRSVEAGLKYFLFGAAASAFTLFGISLVYGATGGTNLRGLIQGVMSPSEPLLLAGVVMTLIGFLFKIAAAPFHLWVADTYEGAPVASAAFIASASKVASFFVLGEILLNGFQLAAGNAGWHSFTAGWTPVIATVAAVSIVLGNFIALAQSDMRRLLGYSAVAHAGYALLGLLSGGTAGFSATLFYSVIYAFTLLGAFAVIGAVRRSTGETKIRNFAGLRRRSPFLAACLTLFFLSLAGLPPLPGFFGKFYLFAVAMKSGANGTALLWLVALGLFGSLVSLYYYVAVLKVVLVDPGDSGTSLLVTAQLERFALGAIAIVVLMFGVWPNFLLHRIAEAFL